MRNFLSEYLAEVLIGLLITVCLGIFGYTFNEMLHLRARVASLEKSAATQESELRSINQALEQRTKDIECRIDIFSNQLDRRFDSLAGIMETLIHMLSAKGTTQAEPTIKEKEG